MGSRVRNSRLSIKRGRYGASKAKAFEVMSDGKWYPSRQLVIASGVTYYSLAWALPRWVRFGYCTRMPIAFNGNYQYHLEPKAKQWLRLAKHYLPNCQLFLNELKAWQAQLSEDMVNHLITAPFVEFVTTLVGLIKEVQKNNAKEY